MKICKTCGKEFKTSIKIDGKWKSLSKRENCTECIPYNVPRQKKVAYSVCSNCGIDFILLKKGQKFCSRSCSATHNNTGTRRHGETTHNKYFIDGFCAYCGNTLKSGFHFCSRKCKSDYIYFIFINKYLLGIENGTRNGRNSGKFSKTVRRYLLNKYNSHCQKCGWGEINIKTKNTPLEVHHIDGNKNNNNLSNFELLCPNCHSLTDNFGALNIKKQRY